MTIQDLYSKITKIIEDENNDLKVFVSTKNSSILNAENNFKDANRISQIEIDDVIVENNVCSIKHKENIVALSRDNEYVFLKWRNDEYNKIRHRLIQLLNDDIFSENLKDKIRNALIEDKFDYTKYVNLEHNL